MTRPALRTLLMVGLPALFLLVFFVAPNAVLLTTSLLKSDSQLITNQVTLENFTYLLASVIVRTYGWWVPLNTDGAVNDTLRAMGFAPLTMLPSTGAIIGLVHSLLPYGVLTILSAINGINPNLEKAAMSLGGSRWRTFVTVTLPFSMPGIGCGCRRLVRGAPWSSAAASANGLPWLGRWSSALPCSCWMSRSATWT